MFEAGEKTGIDETLVDVDVCLYWAATGAEADNALSAKELNKRMDGCM